MSGLHRKSICTEHSARHIAICIQITRADTEIRNVFPGKAGFHIPALGNRTQFEMAIGKLCHGTRIRRTSYTAQLPATGRW